MLLLKLNDPKWLQSINTPKLISGRYYYDNFLIAPALAPEGDILILGMGAGTSAKQMLELFPERNIDGVEIDPTVIKVAEEYFELPQSHKFTIYAEDARPFLRKTDKRYAVIEVDLYQGGINVPFYVVTQEFFSLTKEKMIPDGILIMNVLSPQKEHGNLLVEHIGATIASVYPSVFAMPVGGNTILIATTNNMSIKELLAEMKQTESRYPGLSSVLEGIQQEVYSFIPDPTTLILTDDKAPVDRLTMKAVFG